MPKKPKPKSEGRAAKLRKQDLREQRSSVSTSSGDKQYVALAQVLRNMNLLFFAFFGFLVLYLRSKLDWSILEGLPYLVKVILVVLMLVGVGLQEVLIQSVHKLDRDSDVDIKRRYRLLIWQLVFAIVIITLVISPFLYILGYTNKVAELISTWFPKLQRGVIEAIALITTFATSNIIGILITAIIANLLTDGIKKLYRSWREAGHK